MTVLFKLFHFLGKGIKIASSLLLAYKVYRRLTMTEEEKEKRRLKKNYWLDLLHPDLNNAVIRNYPDFHFNKKMTIRFFDFFMCIKGPPSEGVLAEDVPGLGVKFFPKDKKMDPKIYLFYLHGGGRIMGLYSGAGQAIFCSKLVKQLNLPVFGAKYTTALVDPFPAALNDAVSAYKYLVDSIKKEDPTANNENIKIALIGESAGGGLAAELSQRLLDEHDPKEYPLPVAQILLNPMLDDRTSIDPKKYQADHLIWNHPSNIFSWDAYLGPNCKPGQENIPKYASASRRENLEGLPPAWITVGTLDLFCPETAEYARRLKDARVATEYLEVNGAYHGFVTISEGDEPIMVDLWKSLREFISKYSKTTE